MEGTLHVHVVHIHTCILTLFAVLSRCSCGYGSNVVCTHVQFLFFFAVLSRCIAAVAVQRSCVHMFKFYLFLSHDVVDAVAHVADGNVDELSTFVCSNVHVLRIPPLTAELIAKITFGCWCW